MRHRPPLSGAIRAESRLWVRESDRSSASTAPRSVVPDGSDQVGRVLGCRAPDPRSGSMACRSINPTPPTTTATASRSVTPCGARRVRPLERNPDQVKAGPREHGGGPRRGLLPTLGRPRQHGKIVSDPSAVRDRHPRPGPPARSDRASALGPTVIGSGTTRGRSAPRETSPVGAVRSRYMADRASQDRRGRASAGPNKPQQRDPEAAERDGDEDGA